MGLMDRIKQEAKEGGFKRHPIGTFAATVESVSEKEWDGRIIYEVHVVTDQGKAKVGIWKNTVAELDEAAKRMGSREKAEDGYVKAMGRLCRLYTDLGLAEPHGADEVEMEDNAYGRLGELVDRPCTIVVQEDKKKKGEVIVFINAPQGAQVATGSEPQTAFTAPPPSLDQIPF